MREFWRRFILSFSSKVKAELARHIGQSRHCRVAEIAAIINTCGKIHCSESNKFTLKIQTENAAVARKCYTLIKKTFAGNTEIVVRRNTSFQKNRIYLLLLTDDDNVRKILLATKLLDYEEKEKHIVNQIHPLIVQSTCCKRAYIRGAFLGGGSLSDPEKTYHLEFVNTSYTHSVQLQEMINSFEMDAKIVRRKKYYVVYLKEGSQIVDLLNIMEAHVALMDLENVRIVKEMRNKVNRIVNCETANLKKTVSAAVKQLEDIQYIESTIGLNSLPKSLEEVANFRMQFKDASLKELGQMLDPSVGKSGVNHRLRKINSIAEKIREQREDNNDRKTN